MSRCSNTPLAIVIASILICGELYRKTKELLTKVIAPSVGFVDTLRKNKYKNIILK